MALRSGAMAADTIIRYFSGEIKAAELADSYSRAWEREFRSRLRVALALQGLLLNSKMQDSALRLVHQFPMVGEFLLRKTRGSL
ncbi:MAG: hypothetical protein EHM41_19550 [Chloroflexi bacterium]|nr:MAG: hypothetical protein EHM41_19550 [Chloroflexota bacterium]